MLKSLDMPRRKTKINTMKIFGILALSLGLSMAELRIAEDCEEELCKLPKCRCSSTDIPGGLSPQDTPQFITITFDTAVIAAAMPTYRQILYNRATSKGCPVTATFYVSHEWTDYSMVHELYNHGSEMALNSISHRSPQAFWKNASYDDLVEEIVDQKEQLAHFANIPVESIQGVRLPYLQHSGNTSFTVMKDYKLGYDSTWPTTTLTDPGLWPYTLDYASIQDCPVPTCPTASIEGAWVQPMLAWIDLKGRACAMVHVCINVPDREDTEGWFEFIIQNFERHYLNNRAPFGLYLQEPFLRNSPNITEAVIKFIELVNELEDAFIVTSNEVLEWVKKPISLAKYRKQPCRDWKTTKCKAKLCTLIAEHNNWTYYMTSCNSCPRAYPWLGNPLGE